MADFAKPVPPIGNAAPSAFNVVTFEMERVEEIHFTAGVGFFLRGSAEYWF